MKRRQPLISTRLFIKWGDEPASEPTDTLVLTFSKFFIDLRVCKSDSSIDWAICGIKDSLGIGEDGKPRFRWTHFLDSHGPQLTPDEASFDEPEGYEINESGEMTNPNTNKIESYIERWKRFPIQKGSTVLMLETTSDDDKIFVGRIAGQMIGIRKHGENISARRCELKEGKWETIHKIGDEDCIPDLPLENPIEWKEGDIVQYHNKE
eukprot:TRINITY_DN1898_c0_g1_i1.p1 TRINITY_DN1898_c0_g1~~TRINITY_DN1898_c0_g1_i1.p1  ORF type:complete len:208 (+),score=54.12 TRINITY_DN1898_c0_g1_i1:1-624(+)